MGIGLLIGGLGVLLVGVVLFADDSGFVAPRSIVAIAAAEFLIAGALVARQQILDEKRREDDALIAACGASLITGFALIAFWLVVFQGPDSGHAETNLPLWLLPARVQELVLRVLFYGTVGGAAVLFGALSVGAWRDALRKAGAPGIAAAIALVLGGAIWTHREVAAEAARPRDPLLHLSFDGAIDAGAPVPAQVHGDDVRLEPAGVRGQALWIGGTEDWVDFALPAELDGSGSLTLELWVKRENWLNPYRAGSGALTAVAIEAWEAPPWYRFGAPPTSVNHLALGTQVRLPREAVSTENDRRPEVFAFRPYANVGDSRVLAGALSLPPGEWTHLAVVHDRLRLGELRLYVGGELVARRPPAGSGPRLARLRELRLGTWHEANQAFRGALDELKLYRRALSEEEIRQSASGS